MRIWKYTDGYYAFGEEGAPKSFVPTWEQVIDYLDKHKLPHPHLTSDNGIVYVNKTLYQQFTES